MSKNSDSVAKKTLFFGLSFAALAAASATGGTAAAQTTAEAVSEEEIVVTGFRGSLRQSLEVKRNAVGVVDAITAEDIADFPDLNLAEAIQRIPGVSIDRDAGEGRSLTVRGLSSDFTRTRINGMEAQATAGGTDSSGGANRGRGFDFNVFAADLFNSIKVSKTADAATEEGSLGATVDLQTARPFDYDDFTAAGSLQYTYNDLSEEWDPRGAFLISDRFLDGRLGALVSVAYGERNLLEEGYSSVRWDNAASSGATGVRSGFCSPVGYDTNPSTPAIDVLPASGSGASATNCATGVPRPANTPESIAAFETASAPDTFHPRLPRYGRLTHAQERLGVTGSLQFEPTDGMLLTYDLLYSKLDATRQEDFLESLSFSRNAAAGGKPQVHVLDAIAEGGELVYGLFDNVDVRTESRFDELTTEFVQHSLTFDYDLTDQFHMRAYAGHAQSDFDNPVQTTVTLDRTNTAGYSWDYRPNGDLPLIDYGFDVTDPANWTWNSAPIPPATTPVNQLPRSEIRLRPNAVLTIFQAAQLDFDYRVSNDSTLRWGLNWKTFDSKSTDSRRADETLVPALPGGTTVTNISTLLTGFGSGLDLPAGADTAWLIPDINAIANLFDIYCNCDTGVPGGDFRLASVTNGNARGGNRTIKEEDLSAYFQVDFETELLSMPLRGNGGVRYANTKVDALGYSSTGGGTLVTGSNEYHDVLPSLNLALNVTDDLIARFGAAKVMARPQIGNTFAGTNYLVPTTSLAAGGPNFTASIGNVELEPFRADAIDVSLEWYFAEESLISFAWFYKDINTYIQVIRQNLAYSALTAFNPIAFAPEFCGPPATPACTPDTEFQLTRAVNTEGGPLQGFEISYQQPFFFLPGPLENFGVQLNYTRVSSEIDYCGNVTCSLLVTDDLINLSPSAYNATLYYEDELLSARVSAAYREAYLQNVPGRNNNFREGKQETLNIDASASVNIGDHLTLTLEGVNLTDEVNHQWVGGDGRESTSVFHHTGRQIFAGFRFRY